MKADTSVRTFVETHDSLASLIFDTRNFKRVTQLVYPGCQRLFLRGFQCLCSLLVTRATSRSLRWPLADFSRR